MALVASEAARSRPGFAARFTELVGEPAMQYVTRWRTNMALTWLRTDEAIPCELAARLGYRSEAPFSRAFSASCASRRGR